MAKVSNSKLRKYVFILVYFFGLLFTLEVVSKLIISRVLDVNEQNYAEKYRNDYNLTLLTWMDKYEEHPYFGYFDPTTSAERLRVLERKNEGDYVIAILGGSVAEIFGNFLSENPEYLALLRQSVPEIGSKNIRVVNLALGGYKQPQQFFIASFYLDRIDLLINLDGYNEMMSQDYWPLFPTEFPKLSLKFYGGGAIAKLWSAVGNLLKWTYRAINFTPVQVRGLRHSNTYFLFWEGSHRILYRMIVFVNDRFLAATVGAGSGWHLDKNLAIWKKYTVMESRLAGSYHKPAVFFLQPNQYLRDSKPLSLEERTNAFDPSMADAKNNALRLAQEAVTDISSEGVKIYDLTGVFAGTRETLYTDPCCHFNRRGNEIVAKTMIGIIAQQRTALFNAH
jgi:hypothetical protein